jgi:hypothetical protein
LLFVGAKHSEICLFCLQHGSDQDHCKKRTDKKPTCKEFGCNKDHIKWVHETLTRKAEVNMAECEESGEDEEGCINMTVCAGEEIDETAENPTCFLV